MTLTQEKPVIFFKPQGRMDLETATALSQKMAEVKLQSQQLWVIDLAEVGFMDSSGLVPLVQALKAVRERGCRLVLCNVQAPVRLVLELTHLDSVFEIVDNYEDIDSQFDEKSLATV
ncbi:MAG: anti-sigma factor antagonist [Nostocales cyanobacterium]|nr:MAG: anti-sigma factor antagonist [Nostocales cyanobacterium]TAF19095.1 MAG: anti-sigma factor antagonist [Nostocales cyanobacterium]